MRRSAGREGTQCRVDGLRAKRAATAGGDSTSVRLNFFHYVLYAHARGKPKELCLTGTPTDQATCRATNPDFHVPSSSSGVERSARRRLDGDARLLGRRLRRHPSSCRPRRRCTSSVTACGVRTAVRRSRPCEANCKPNYLSVMNYLFQLTGLRRRRRRAAPGLLARRRSRRSTRRRCRRRSAPLPYRTAWYAPLVPGTAGVRARHAGGDEVLQRRVASRTRCRRDGCPLARIESGSLLAPIDWNADGSRSGILRRTSTSTAGERRPVVDATVEGCE